MNTAMVRYVVERAEALNAVHGKNLQFVVATNLARLSDDIIEFARDRALYFSTSLDGPADLHDKHRPLKGASSHEVAVRGIRRIQTELGPDRISALMTTTPASLARVRDIIDEYMRLGLTSIFLRPLSPYGFAARSLVRKYETTGWLEFYKEGLAYILELCRNGQRMREDYATILLQKMFSAQGASYVDLQSPAGLGIAALVFNYDGHVFASDEARMLSEMGDQTFRLGKLGEHSYEEMLAGDALVGWLDESLPESAPMCSDCPYQPFCGADPVFHHATSGNVLGHKATSSFCQRQMGVVGHLVQTMEDDPAARRILKEWS